MSEQKSFFDGDQRMWFVFGLVTGIALMALLGGGFDLGKVGGSGGNGGGNVAAAPTPSNNGGAAPAGQPVPEANDDDHIRGNLNKAKVVLIEYSDFECPFCARHHPTMQQIVDDYGDDVAWVYRHFPLTSIHQEATPAAIASECAAEQGEFWGYADALVDNYQTLGNSTYARLADDLGLNTNKFEDCLADNDYAELVANQAQAGIAAGATGTPATFINGTLVSGAVPLDSMKTMIDEILANS